MAFLAFLSLVFGWVYTFCWSLSFYPQPLLSFRRRSTTGSTVDFPFINCLGFLAYFAYTVALYASPTIRAQYAFRNHDTTPTVQLNDIAFALHALILSIITTSQYFVPKLWGFPRGNYSSSSSQPSRLILGLFFGSILAIAITWLLVLASPRRDPNDWCELDVVYAASYAKLLISVVKYTPQVVANYRNKSTTGWSIWQPLLDAAGGVLSVAQLLIDSYLIRDWSGITGNPVKFALGNVAIVYDCIFVVQHYVLYRPHRLAGTADERSALLDGDQEERGRREE